MAAIASLHPDRNGVRPAAGRPLIEAANVELDADEYPG